MRGLIAAALGGVSRGVGQVAEKQIEVNSRKALMEAEEEMNARLAEAAEGRQIASEGRADTRQLAAEGRAEAAQIAAENRAEASQIAAENRLDPVERQQLSLLQEQLLGVKRDSAWTEKERDTRELLSNATTDAERDEAMLALDAFVTTGSRAQRAQDNVAAGARFVDVADLNFQQADEIREDIREGRIFEPDDVTEANRRISTFERNAERALLNANELLTGGGRGRPASTPGLLRDEFNPPSANRPDLSSFLRSQ